MNRAIFAVAIAATVLGTSQAQAFDFKFDWGNLPRCTSGNPGSARSPAFTVNGAPAGTAKIKFNLRDLDAPGFVHGGGTAAYAGKGAVLAGAFKYLRPCPPDGSHNYQWTATALDAGGKTLGSAKAQKRYP